MLYTLRAVPGVRNSPPEPAVHLIEADVSGLDTLRTHTLTPEQAVTLAGDLRTAAGLPRVIDFARDPSALAWARAGVRRFIDKMRTFERQAAETGTTDPVQWRKIANLAEREFIGGHGCVIATFDERRPSLPGVTS